MSGKGGYSFTPVCRAGVGQGTLYEQFHKDVKGDSPIHDNASAFQGLADEYKTHQDAFKTALEGIKTTYTGSAADSMQSAFEPLVNSMGEGHTMTQQAATALTGQAGQFTTTQSKINNTVPVPDEPWYEPVDPWNTDHDDAVDKNNGINNANNAAYQQYASASGSNVQTFPQFGDGSTMNPNGISVTSTPVDHVGPGTGHYTGTGGGGGSYSPNQVGGGSGGGGGSNQPGTGGGGGQYPVGSVGDGGGQYQPPGGSTTNLQGTGSGSGGGYPGGSGSGSYPGAGGSGGGSGSGGGFGGFPVAGGFGGGAGGGGYGGGSGAGGSGGGLGGARGGMGSGATAGAGAGAGSRPGAGAAAGVGAAEEGGVGGGPGAAAGARGASGAGGMAGGQGRGGKKEEDSEHKSAAYLVSEEDEIVGDLPATLPAGGVIGG